jgi:Domain of unknown function (DUF4333)
MTTKHRRSTAVVIGALVAVSLAACGTKEISAKDAAKDVRAGALAPIGVRAAVVCPDKTKAKKGKQITCRVKDADGKKGTVTATMTNDDGKLGKFEPDVKKLQVAVIQKNATTAAAAKGVDGKVFCPSTITPKAGSTYTCFASVKGSGLGQVKVTQTTPKSEVTVAVVRRKLRTRQIQANIRKALSKRGINATVTCPPRVTSKLGSTFQCTVSANGKSLKVVATQTDSSGNFRLKVQK